MKKANLTVLESEQKSDMILAGEMLFSEVLKEPQPMPTPLAGCFWRPAPAGEPAHQRSIDIQSRSLKPRPEAYGPESKDLFAQRAAVSLELDKNSIKDSRNKAMTPNFFTSAVATWTNPLEASTKIP
jgi:hypothetical protein